MPLFFLYNFYFLSNPISVFFCQKNADCDLMIFKGNISYSILLLKSPLTLENTKFIAGELSLKGFLVLYLPTEHYKA